MAADLLSEKLGSKYLMEERKILTYNKLTLPYKTSRLTLGIFR
jgi:hypothetical protein